MKKITLEEYNEYVKNQRKAYFPSPFEFVYETFTKLGYDKKSKSFFQTNASDFVTDLRKQCWDAYKPLEEQFQREMLMYLIDPSSLSGMTPLDALLEFTSSYPNHIYNLNLSNTQSRRSRAGKEFEAIIELLFMGAKVPMDSQGSIGRKVLVDKGLGKLVDVVSPGVVEFEINKANIVLVSAKTTLRERWAEVPEEKQRTGIKEIYLSTVDTEIGQDVLDKLYDGNIYPTTTKQVKAAHYAGNRRVKTFEELISECITNDTKWAASIYTPDEIEKRVNSIKKQKKKKIYCCGWKTTRIFSEPFWPIIS